LELYHHTPRAPLHQFVLSFVYFKGFQPAHSIDRFLPDGNIEVIIDLLDEPKHIYDNETLEPIQTCRYVWASGFRSEPICIPSGKDSEMLVIYFRKGRCNPFFQIPLHGIAGTVVSGDEIFGPDILLLRESLMYAISPEEKFSLAEDFLLGRAGSFLERNPFVNFAVDRLEENPSTLSIMHLSQKVGYSQKHMIDIFKSHVGTTPKKFMRVLRFQKAIQEIEHAGNIRWSQLALECGYYDQAHFINDFRTFSGYSPREYMERKNSVLNYIPVA
jgi:AraC-like DNA-binding protein